MIRRGFSLIAMVVMVLGAVVSAGAQSSGQVAVPKDPAALMVLAAKTNGLAGLDDHAWHVKATYQIFDADGKPEQSGVYEEWWAGPKKYKISYTSANFNQTIYMSAAGGAETGDTGEPPMQLEMAKGFLLRPLPSADFVAKLHYEARSRKTGLAEMRCVAPQSLPEEFWKRAEKWAKPGGMGLEVPQTCFNKGMAAVRAEIASSGWVAVFNQVVDAGGQYIAKEIEIGDGGVRLVNLNVTTLEFPALIPAAELMAPASAAKGSPLEVGAGVMAGHRIGGEAVKYPLAAREQRIQGLVILGAAIDSAGSIADLQVIAGPKLLRDAAAQAVKTWRYKPYLLNGRPVEVRTQINVVFSMGS